MIRPSTENAIIDRCELHAAEFHALFVSAKRRAAVNPWLNPRLMTILSDRVSLSLLSNLERHFLNHLKKLVVSRCSRAAFSHD
jgi:hypothetical protein